MITYKQGENILDNIIREISTKTNLSQDVIYHMNRSSEYTNILAKNLGLSFDESSKIYFASKLHDIGKISVPYHILNGTRSITKQEFDDYIIPHTYFGKEIISRLNINPTIKELMENIAFFHHENYDGSGYYGYEGENIPLEAQLLKVADIYDSLTSTRTYNTKLTHEKTMKILLEGSTKNLDKTNPNHFSKRLIKSLIDSEKELKQYLEIYSLKNVA